MILHMRRNILFRFCLLPIALLIGISSQGVFAQTALEALLEKIPSVETGDSNRYCLTDIQFALDAGLSWNPLLRRAVLREESGGLSFTLIVGSQLGRVGPHLVEWPVAPALHDGQIYVSEELLATIFRAYPDYRFPGQVEESPTPTPTIVPLEDLAPPEEPPAFFEEDSTAGVKTLVATFYPPRGAIVSASGSLSSATAVFAEELRSALSAENLNLKTWSSDPNSNKDHMLSRGDVLIAFKISCASPTPKTSFFTHESLAAQTGSKQLDLVEWGTSGSRQKDNSREIAEILSRHYAREFGESRSIGLRNSPVDILQGRREPAVLVNLGISDAEPEAELRKAAKVVAQTLVELQRME